MRHSIVFGAIAVAMGALLAQPAAADKVSDHYRGKTVTIIFGYSVGGTYGKTSLVLSHHLGRHIPGNPTIITQSMPGAGGMKAANYAYNAMPKNGLYLLMPPDMSIVSQVLRPKKVKYDARKFTYLGRVFGSNNLIAVRRDSGVTTLEQAKNKSVIMGSTGKGSPTFIIPSLANGLVGTKFKIVQGYRGSGPTKLAMEQGEVRGISLAWASWKNNKLAWFTGSNSFAVGLLQSGFVRDKDLPDIPLIRELVQGKEAKSAADLIATSTLIGRSLALPPGAPGFLTEPLREAFWNTVNSQAFKDDATKTKLPLLQLKGVEIQNTVDKVLDMSPVAIAKARSAIFGN